MREIKFRCWEGYTSEKEFEYYSFKEHNMWVLHELRDDATERLQQYTGLLDKQGKEIYEGDIIEFYDSAMKKCVGEIVWSDRLAGFNIMGKSESIFDKSFDNESNMVIGNIYENPELLE